MTTAAQALDAVRAQLTGLAYPVYFHGDDPPTLPGSPATFAYVVFNNEGSGAGPAAFGGGRGQNRYRNRALVEAYVFKPLTGERGLAPAMEAAELLASRLRSHRDADISCFSADVIPVGPGSSITPPGFQSDVSNYNCAVAEIALHFDQIG